MFLANPSCSHRKLFPLAALVPTGYLVWFMLGTLEYVLVALVIPCCVWLTGRSVSRLLNFAARSSFFLCKKSFNSEIFEIDFPLIFIPWFVDEGLAVLDVVLPCCGDELVVVVMFSTVVVFPLVSCVLFVFVVVVVCFSFSNFNFGSFSLTCSCCCC